MFADCRVIFTLLLEIVSQKTAGDMTRSTIASTILGTKLWPTTDLFLTSVMAAFTMYTEIVNTQLLAMY